MLQPRTAGDLAVGAELTRHPRIGDQGRHCALAIVVLDHFPASAMRRRIHKGVAVGSAGGSGVAVGGTAVAVGGTAVGVAVGACPATLTVTSRKTVEPSRSSTRIS